MTTATKISALTLGTKIIVTDGPGSSVIAVVAGSELTRWGVTVSAIVIGAVGPAHEYNHLGDVITVTGLQSKELGCGWRLAAEEEVEFYV